MADILDIKRALAASALAVAEHLLPGGRKERDEWRAGSTAGDKGDSLGVHLSGQKAGVWSDFATGEGGDLLDLWRAAKGCDLPAALDQAKKWLGIVDPTPYREPRQAYTRPAKPACTAPKDRVRDYLCEDRNIPFAVLERYKVGAFGDEIIFPFLLPDGELALAKARKAENGASPRPTAANCEPVLFGWQAIPSDARMVVITEGEIDALSWGAYDIPAMSVPFGGGKGGKQNWIENEFDRLARFERIFISTDMDKVGDEAAEEIASRLGRHRCYRVRLPHKDANDCLVNGMTAEQMHKLLADAANLDPAGLHTPSDYDEKVRLLFWPEPGKRQGYTVPYGKLDGKVTFRPGDVTLWTGASGSGKSQILSDCTPHWIMEGARVCVASFEMPPAQTLRRMVKQAGNVDRPTPEYLTACLSFLDNGVLLYEKVGKSGIEPLLEVFDYARAKYGCDMFVIDSLMRLGIAADDYSGQEKAMYQLVDWTLKHNVHTHLVAHARKAEKGSGVSETEDVKGASEIGSNAANILAVWRNRRLEDEILAADSDALRETLMEKPGVILNVAKQRHGDFEGKVGLWFDQRTYRYQSSYDRGQWTGRVYPIERESVAA